MEQQVAQPQVALPGVPGVGEVLAEKFRVEGILGVGGMGVVLGARHLQLGQLVAIKVLSVSAEHQPDSIERFLREGRAAAALNSDHVVRIYDVGQLPTGLPFMVMERLRGQDLSSHLTELGPLPVADAVEYVAQATMAIVEAHEVGIVHRDLKPGNLFLTQRSDGSACVKVLDFGISKQLTDLEAQTLQGALTSTRQVMGSPAYMSPEQVRDAKAVDHRTDIWALGATLYELLTQHAAFDADTLPAICAAIAADPPVPIRSRRADVPLAIEAIITCCLEKSPAKRYQSARALLSALREYQGRATDPTARFEANGPETEASSSLDTGTNRGSKYHYNLNESGLRSIESVPLDAVDGTLVSGRSPIIGASTTGAQVPSATWASGSSRQFAIIALIIFGLGGGVTGWLVTHRSTPNPAAADDRQTADGQPTPNGQTPKDKQSANGRPAANVQTPTGAHPAVDKQSPTDTQPAADKTHFVLRIISEPSQALVLEAGNPIGVTPLSVEVDRTVVQRTARQFVVRKAGFMDVGIQQGDSLTDVQQNVTLSKIVGGAADTQTPKSLAKPAAKRPSATASAAPSSAAPGIRITR